MSTDTLARTLTARLAFIGLGGMGGGMAARLAESGFTLTVHNRTAAKAEPLREVGASVARTPESAVEGAGIVLLSLSDEAAVDGVLFDRVLPRLAAGTYVIDTSTVSPSYARRAASRLADRGVRRVEACVVGNPPMARSGALRVFTAGEPSDVDAVRPVLDALGREVHHLGAPGAASALKLALNMMLGAQTAALAEAVAFGLDAGLDRDLLITAITDSGFSSPVLSFRAEFMRTRRYEPAAFRTRLMEKDLRLVLGDIAGRTGLPVTAAVADRFAVAVANGDGDRDAAVVVESAG
jgi:3-hydroxyisobutyrate dehydrogenase-like beta-hydroxyacid dehydrogenase